MVRRQRMWWAPTFTSIPVPGGSSTSRWRSKPRSAAAPVAGASARCTRFELLLQAGGPDDVEPESASIERPASVPDQRQARRRRATSSPATRSPDGPRIIGDHRGNDDAVVWTLDVDQTRHKKRALAHLELRDQVHRQGRPRGQADGRLRVWQVRHRSRTHPRDRDNRRSRRGREVPKLGRHDRQAAHRERPPSQACCSRSRWETAHWPAH